ncbi:SRPBCC family protein [Halorussus halobius]|uniref:SRPBCC family protein n=1 Tax=Halorussus halobius TaxID=1710537 RepID=UPI0010921C0A|nr:SRPBCC family protein [Halorussus halobius]
MPTYQREVRVAAPLDDVWAFHSRVEGLESLTPDWMGLRVEGVRRPGDERDGGDADVLDAGTEIRLSVRPLGVGPRQRWTSRITRRERGDGGSGSDAPGGSSRAVRSDGAAVFEDEMVDGPFPVWHHRHQFYAVSDDETLVRDRVTYELPVVGRLPVVGGLLGPLGWLGFEPMFRERHRRTRRILEE